MSLVITSMRFQLLVCLTDLCGGLIYINNEKKKRKEKEKKKKEKKNLVMGKWRFYRPRVGGGVGGYLPPLCDIYVSEKTAIGFPHRNPD